MRDEFLFLASAFIPIARGPSQQFGWTRSTQRARESFLASISRLMQRIDRIPLVKDFELVCIQNAHPLLAGGLRGVSFFIWSCLVW